MLDLVVRSDRVVTPHGVGAYDVAIQGDKIVAVAAQDTLTGDVNRLRPRMKSVAYPMLGAWRTPRSSNSKHKGDQS